MTAVPGMAILLVIPLKLLSVGYVSQGAVHLYLACVPVAFMVLCKGYVKRAKYASKVAKEQNKEA